MTIDDYIYEQNPRIQERLWSVRNAISTAIPDADERITWSIPTYWKCHNIIHFAAGRNYIVIYPGPAAIKEFLPRLSEYITTKGVIHLPNSKELPLDLIKEIAQWNYERNRE